MEESVREDLREKTRALIARIKTNQTNESDFLPMDSVTFDCDPSWVDEIMNSKTPHDTDYYLFKYLNATMGVILDVGANYGYSVASIRAVGSCCPIISFEALPVFEACLARVKELDGHGHDFIISGISAKKEAHEFLVPTVNARTISALATASVSNLNEYTINNILSYVENHSPKADSYRVNFIKIPIISDTIDHLIRTRKFDVPTSPIVGMKIDVEGLELDVLKGSVKTIAANKPLLIVEGGIWIRGMKEFLDATGYVVASRVGTQVQLSDNSTQQGVNGIFIHRDNISIYQNIGLIVAS
jgi:FkbM family methyltransferase